MRTSKKVLAVLLTIATIIGIFSCATTVFAEDLNEYTEEKAYQEKLLTETVETEEGASEIVCEVPEKRDEYSKTYKRADGSFTSVLSKTPIHKLEDGEWKEINNTLKEVGSTITNTDGAFDVEFPETITENEQITVTNNGESIAFSVNDIGNADGVLEESQTTETDVIKQDLDKTVSQITYEAVDENTDIQYIVAPSYVKENIIVSDKASLKESYSFDIEKGDLSAELDSENNLIFKNSENETVFTIPAPVMTDALNTVCYDIEVTVENADKSVLTLSYTPSKEWLESADRAFPIVIDPLITTSYEDEEIIADTFIYYASNDPDAANTNYINSPFGVVADQQPDENGVYGKGYVLVKFNMDVFEKLNAPGITVTDANYYLLGYAKGGNILAKEINTAWNPATITYSQVFPTDDITIEDYSEPGLIDYYTGVSADVEEPDMKALCFNITEQFTQWLTGEKQNNGFALVPENQGVTSAVMLGGYIANGDKKTYVESYCSIDYVDTSGYNDSFEYLTQSIGRAGNADVNTFSRSVSVNRTDLAMDGLRMPADVSFNYVPAFRAFGETIYTVIENLDIGIKNPYLPYGNNWIPSALQFIVMINENRYEFFSGEGTQVSFKLKEETMTETIEGVETKTTTYTFEETETSDSGYTLELIDRAQGVDLNNLKLTNPDGEGVYFNQNGLATEIREAKPNSDGTYDKILVQYNQQYPFAIEQITDGIGRKYVFEYDMQKGVLTSVKCLTADGTSVKAGTTDTDLKVTYGYDSNNNLTSVTYPDGEAVTYTYDSNGNLVKIQNIDGYNIQYTYDNTNRITNIAEYAGTTNGNSIHLTQLSNRQVKVDDDFSGTQTYQFGRDGKLLYTFDEKGNYLKSDYAPARDENVYTSNDWRITSENLLKNGSFEVDSALSNTRAKYWSAEFETTNLPEQQFENEAVVGYDSSTFGNKVYLISSESKCTEYVTQTVDVDNATSYTFSAFVRSQTTGVLTLKISATDASGNVQTAEPVTIDSTTGWERYSVTYSPKNFEPEKISVSIGFEDNRGTYYVDCVQLESGLGTAEYNLIENGSFNNEDAFWSEATVVTDLINLKPVKAVKLSGGLPSYNVGDGLIRPADTYYLEDHISAITQNVKINGKKRQTFTVGGWFKGEFDDNYSSVRAEGTNYQNALQQLANSSAQIKVTYTYTDTVTTTDETTNETTTTEQLITENFVVDFVAHNDGWQYAADTFALKGDTESVDVTVLAKNISTDSYATGIELTSDNDSISFFETEEVTEIPEECPCEDCEELDCTCRCEDICTCVQCKRQSDIETTSEDGKTVTTSTFDGEKYMQSAVTYSDDLNNIISETDENNITSGYAYNVNGGLTSFTDGAGNQTTYQSNAMGYLTLAESNASGLTDNAVKMAISYIYDGDLLTNVNQGNVQYTYEYDGWGQLIKVLVDGETLICYTYGEKEYRTRILSIVFGSSENTGFTVLYSYDLETGNINSVKKYRMVDGEEDSITYNYKYDNLGNLDYIKDNGTGHFLDYTDDGIIIKDGENGPVIYETKDVTPEPEAEDDEITEGEADNTEETDDGIPEIVSITQETAKGPSSEKSYNHKIYESSYSEETGKSTENEAVSVVESQDENGNFTYGKTIGTQTISDWFGRNEAVTVMTKDPVDTATTDFASISSQYNYVTNDNVTTNLISSVTNTISGGATKTVNYTYTYDSNGRITNASTVSNVPNLSGSSQYVYDEAGQLVEEITGSETFEYAYDSKGNISTRKVYSGETLVSTDTFTYATGTWEDRLTGYNGETITYDSIGNPTSYRGATLSWRGRELVGYSKGNKQISYSYDVDGMRYRKVVTENNITKIYDYVYSDGTLILLTYTENGVSNTARFVYDSWGEPRGFMLNDSATYLYLKNAQGDITGIVDENGEIVVRYNYNSWGAVDFVVPFGIDPSASTILATVSPFTYRGYCYDYDIGMYYLQSRYYDPEICRFINADSTDYLGATGTLLSYNLFAYCENDGVNAVDYEGSSPVSAAAKVLGFANDVLMAESHYKHNKKLDKHVRGYINGQDFWPYCKFQYGVGTLDYNGCELIAIYNALRALGKTRKLSKIIYDFEFNGAMWLNGVFGTKPQAIGSYIRSCGLKTKSFSFTSSMDKYVKKGRIFIICYSYADIGIHTVMAKGLKDGKIKIYNRYDNRDKTYTMDSIKNYVSEDGFKLIVGYYIYK